MEKQTEPAPRIQLLFSLPAGKFRLGDVFISPEARKALSDDEIKIAVVCHLRCDWGKHDWKAIDDVAKSCDRLFSQHTNERGTKVWVITEADRSATTIVLPGEY